MELPTATIVRLVRAGTFWTLVSIYPKAVDIEVGILKDQLF